jgi:hypothetical protein
MATSSAASAVRRPARADSERTRGRRLVSSVSTAQGRSNEQQRPRAWTPGRYFIYRPPRPEFGYPRRAQRTVAPGSAGSVSARLASGDRTYAFQRPLERGVPAASADEVPALHA